MLMKTRGFTLIELSIVLVIIGLLVGGVLVGRDLIKAAEIQKVISQAEQYKTVFYTFKNKYNCIPGDCRNATTFFGTPTGIGCSDVITPVTDGTCNGNA